MVYPREGTRRKGKLLQRWEDDIVKTSGKTWTRLAQKREDCIAEGAAIGKTE